MCCLSGARVKDTSKQPWDILIVKQSSWCSNLWIVIKAFWKHYDFIYTYVEGGSDYFARSTPCCLEVNDDQFASCFLYHHFKIFLKSITGLIQWHSNDNTLHYSIKCLLNVNVSFAIVNTSLPLFLICYNVPTFSLFHPNLGRSMGLTEQAKTQH